MKKIIVLVCILSISFIQAQNKKTTFEKQGELVKATYYYENGDIEKQGFFKNNKLEGTWVSYNTKGKKTAIAHYTKGKKTGKWFMWGGNILREIDYKDNIIASVQEWKEDSKIAFK